MRHDVIGRGAEPKLLRDRYEGSRLYVRAPLRKPMGNYIACAGGTETFGLGLARPYPALLERRTRRVCINLGVPHAGPGALLDDSALLEICAGAEQVVLQATGAAGLSNRFFTVHPRRNDRFLRASATLRALYPEIDFTDFCFVRHMLGALQGCGAVRFELVRAELRTAWSERMRLLIDRIGVPVTLVVMPTRVESGDLGDEPLFVSREMLDALRPKLRGIVRTPPGAGPAQHLAVARQLSDLLAEAG
jgi:hypothetical protein